MNVNILRPRALTAAVRAWLRIWPVSPAPTPGHARQEGARSNEASRYRAAKPRWYW